VSANNDCRNPGGPRQRLPQNMRRIKYTRWRMDSSRCASVIEMRRIAATLTSLAFGLALAGASAFAQAPSGPLTPKPGADVQLPPKDAKSRLKVQVALVNTPVTVRNSRGEMVNSLEARDFQITDNGVGQQISHFDLGGDPISLAILIETSSRVEALLPEIRKTGTLFTQTVIGS